MPPTPAPEPAQACRICGEVALIPYYDFGRRLYARAIGYTASCWGCTHCGHRQFLPDLKSSDLAAVYAEPYFSIPGEEEAYAELYRAGGSAVTDVTARLMADGGVKPGARVHEFGCGTGLTVWGLRNKGFDATGSDWSSGAMRFAHEQGNTFVFQEDMNTPAAMAGTPLDVIVSNDAIEHVPDPVEMLRGLAALAGPETRITIRTNHGDGAVNRRLGMFFDLFYYFPHHIHSFSARSLLACAERAGLKPLLIRDAGALTQELRDAALGPLAPGETEADREARMVAQFGGERLESVFVRADSPVPGVTPEVPEPSIPEQLCAFHWDSHGDHFLTRSPWSRLLVNGRDLKPVRRMRYTRNTDSWEFGAGSVGDHWMQDGGQPPYLPMLQFQAPVAGDYEFVLTLSNRYVDGSPMRVSLIAPGAAAEHFQVEHIDPRETTRRFRLAAGAHVALVAQAQAPAVLQKTTCLLGVRLLSAAVPVSARIPVPPSGRGPLVGDTQPLRPFFDESEAPLLPLDPEPEQVCGVCGETTLVPWHDFGRRLRGRTQAGEETSLYGCRHCGHKRWLPAAPIGAEGATEAHGSGLSHAADPVQELRRLAEAAGDNGQIEVADGNGDGAVARRLGAVFEALHPSAPPLHLFSARSLATAAERAGLAVVSVRSSGEIAAPLRAAALGPLKIGQSEAEQNALAGARFEGDQLEALLTPASSASITAPFELPRAEVPEPVPAFEWDSHGDFYTRSPVWKRQLAHGGNRVVWDQMAYSDALNRYEWGHSAIGDSWMGQWGNAPWAPMLAFESPGAGEFEVDLLLANRFGDRAPVRATLIGPDRKEERFYIDHMAPRREKRRFTLRRGEQVALLAESEGPETRQITTVMLGVRRIWPRIEERRRPSRREYAVAAARALARRIVHGRS